MTESEKICNEIGVKFFCKDYVYQGLKYRDAKNNKIELCDGLFEYSETYMALQIKERSKNTQGKSEEDWLKDVVYGVAAKQIINTINGIRSVKIEVRDLYQQRVQLHENYSIYPVIIFDNNKIQNYSKVIEVEGLKINVFRIDDYEKMMNSVSHPFDIFYYLSQRVNYISDSLPSLIISDLDDFQAIANIDGEDDFADFIMCMKYKGDFSFKVDALKILSIIEKFRKKQAKVNPHYKEILNVLQKIEPSHAPRFMERFNYAWKVSHENKFDITKAMQIIADNKKIDIIFCSIGTTPLCNVNHYEIICDAKQLQHKSDCVVLISFIGVENNECLIDWAYYEKKYVPDDKMFDCYEKLGMYNGTITREIFEQMCKGIN